jgi:A/G-specific adenine glycosylase
MEFSNILLSWYQTHKRDLPWRNTSNPYYIWVSEIILQQTRVQQGLAYYLRFIERFPSIELLAESKLDEVLKLWEGLGYYSRARNMHKAAQQIVHQYKGKFPNTYSSLLKLNGVGDYTASAIASFAFNESVPVIDGNVYRVIGRYLGISYDINSVKGKTKYKEAASELMDSKNAAQYNQAIMEFGALQCVPKNPNCDVCPLNGSCYSAIKQTVEEFPVKRNKVKITQRFFYFFVVSCEETFVLHQRKANDIWNNLYQFPLIEVSKKESIENIVDQFTRNRDVDAFELLGVSKEVKHVLSHQHIFARFIRIELNEIPGLKANEVSVSRAKMKEYSLPRIITRYLEQNDI